MCYPLSEWKKEKKFLLIADDVDLQVRNISSEKGQFKMLLRYLDDKKFSTSSVDKIVTFDENSGEIRLSTSGWQEFRRRLEESSQSE
jgi:hypothetical protein